MADDTKYITIDSDKWDDLGKVYRVIDYTRGNHPTSVQLTLQNEDGQLYKRVVPSFCISRVEGNENVSF